MSYYIPIKGDLLHKTCISIDIPEMELKQFDYTFNKFK